jgi:hypothetical protein
MTVQFRVRALSEPHCLPRLLDNFAQRGLIPSAISASHVGEVLEIVIEHPTIDDPAAQFICERMARMVPIESVSMNRIRSR